MGQAERLSLEGLIAWLETQPADTAYDWTAPCECLIGQWLKSMGFRDVFGMSNKIVLTDPFYDISINTLNSIDHAHTFGSALKRAREALATPHPETAVSP